MHFLLLFSPSQAVEFLVPLPPFFFDTSHFFLLLGTMSLCESYACLDLFLERGDVLALLCFPYPLKEDRLFPPSPVFLGVCLFPIREWHYVRSSCCVV